MKSKILIIIITLILGIYGSSPPSNDIGTHTRMFCAYDKMFIEFDDGKNIWGTMWLDQVGRPIACRNGENISDKSIIL